MPYDYYRNIDRDSRAGLGRPHSDRRQTDGKSSNPRETMTIAIGILSAVCSISAGWFIGRGYERNIWKTRCRVTLQIIKNLKEQMTE